VSVAAPGPRRPAPAPAPTRIPIEPRASDVERDTAELAARVALVTRGAARAAVLGVNDGLVTNVCLILAVAGADVSASSVRIAGLASLIAGALSMAAGEWVSVRSQVDLYNGLLDELRQLVARNPRVVLDELASRLEEAGFGRDTARTASTELPLDEPRFFRFASQTMFGIDPHELGSPMTAAMSSPALFAGGALVPLLPWFFTSGSGAVLLSISVTAVASLVVGGIVSRSSGRRPWLGATRQFGIVVVASAVTFGVGRLFGIPVS